MILSSCRLALNETVEKAPLNLLQIDVMQHAQHKHLFAARGGDPLLLYFASSLVTRDSAPLSEVFAQKVEGDHRGRGGGTANRAPPPAFLLGPCFRSNSSLFQRLAPSSFFLLNCVRRFSSVI